MALKNMNIDRQDRGKNLKLGLEGRINPRKTTAASKRPVQLSILR